MSYTIRRMTKEDIPQVQQVAKLSWNDTYAGIIPHHIQNKFLQTAYSKSSLLWRLKQSNQWIAEKEGRVVGFAIFSPLNECGEAELGAIYLHPHFQRMGIGSALIEVAKDEIKGLKRIVLSVEKSNRNGLHFYDKKGFQIEAEYDEHIEGHVFKTVKMILEM